MTHNAAVALPTLIVVSGPPGSGKTTLAREIAGALGCPAIIRDEIKEGMVSASPGYEPGESDLLNIPTLKAFFDVLGVLVRARVTIVAEAAFQDRLWRPHLEPLTRLADVRIIRCTVDAGIARDRVAHRATRSTHRAAHADGRLLRALATGEPDLDAFGWISLDLPTLTVETTNGYQPGLSDIIAFAGDGRTPTPGGRVRDSG